MFEAMGQEAIYHNLLSQARKVYNAHDALCTFASFPDDTPAKAFEPEERPPCRLLQNERGLSSKHYADLQKAIIDAAPYMKWRQIYTDASQHMFMDRLGCYSVIGGGAPFISDTIRLFVVYMPDGLYYPWHIHPAEEIYMVIAGKAIFRRAGHADEVLAEGQTMFHHTNQPHAIETQNTPMLSLVAWRNHLDTPPILVDIEQ